VHHDSEPARRPVYLDAVRDGVLPPGWAVDDGAALLFRGGALDDVLTARRRARAHAVTGDGELPLPARALEPPDARRATIPAVAELRRLHTARMGVARD
jgi:dipeptidase E